MSDEYRCRRTTVVGMTSRATVSTLSSLGSGRGRKARGTQLGRVGRERGTQLGRIGSETHPVTWRGAALAGMENRTKATLMRSDSEEKRRGRRLNDEHRCRSTTVGGITARATLRAGRGSGQGRRERGTQIGWIRGETVPATWVGVALAGMGAGVCQTAVASPTAAIVVTITTATGDGRDSQRTAVANTIVTAARTATTEGGGAPFEAHKDPRRQVPPEWIVQITKP